MPLDPEAQKILDVIGAAGSVDPFSMTPSEWREAFSSMPGKGTAPELARIEDFAIPGPAGALAVRLYSPGAAADRPLRPGVVFFHGGGFVLCGLDTHDSTCREFAAGAECVVVSVDYRLAPEAPFPAAPEDCYAATSWVAREAARLGIDADRIAVAGDSAGGNLAAVVSQIAKARGGPALVHQLLVYPVTDAAMDTPSYQKNGEGYFLSRDMMRWFWHHYLAQPENGSDPLASPLRASDLSNLPSATVLTAEYDPLRDEGRAYAERLAESGVETRYVNYDGVFHGFFAMPTEIPRARKAVDDACAALRSAFGYGSAS